VIACLASPSQELRNGRNTDVSRDPPDQTDFSKSAHACFRRINSALSTESIDGGDYAAASSNKVDKSVTLSSSRSVEDCWSATDDVGVVSAGAATF